MRNGYFPRGVYERWQQGDAITRGQLDKQYGIQSTLSEITYPFGESVFVKYMVKEMARFLQCKPNLDAVIEASNDRGSNYWQYVNSLFRDVQIENAMLDTGNAEGMDAAGIDRFEKAIAPTRSRHILRVETIEGPLLQQDISFSELRDQFIEKVRQGLDGNGNYGKRSYGMKSYLMPFIGVVKPLYDAKSPALQTEKKSWHEAKICGVIC